MNVEHHVIVHAVTVKIKTYRLIHSQSINKKIIGAVAQIFGATAFFSYIVT